MNIYKITSRSRRDFTAILVCEHCENTQELDSGYDDNYYHLNVIPKIKCEKCDKTASKEYVPNKPKYPDSEVI